MLINANWWFPSIKQTGGVLFTPEQVINAIKQGILDENSGNKGVDLASIITRILELEKIKKVKQTTLCQTKGCYMSIL